MSFVECPSSFEKGMITITTLIIILGTYRRYRRWRICKPFVRNSSSPLCTAPASNTTENDFWREKKKEKKKKGNRIISASGARFLPSIKRKPSAKTNDAKTTVVWPTNGD